MSLERTNKPPLSVGPRTDTKRLLLLQLGTVLGLCVGGAIPLCFLAEADRGRQVAEQMARDLDSPLTNNEIKNLREEFKTTLTQNQNLSASTKEFLNSYLNNQDAELWKLTTQNLAKQQFHNIIISFAEETERLMNKHSLKLDFAAMSKAATNNEAALFFRIYRAMNLYDFAIEQNKSEPGFVDDAKMEQIKELILSMNIDNAKITTEAIEAIVLRDRSSEEPDQRLRMLREYNSKSPTNPNRGLYNTNR